MLKIIPSRIYFLVLLIFSFQISFSQTIINYQTWAGASGCNIFSSPTNVPVTINGTNSTITHLTAIGQPTYDNINQSVDLVSEIVNGSQNQGTEYTATVNFKQGYSYNITINAARIMSQQTGPNVLLRLDLNNGGNGGNTLCNGTGIIDAFGSGGFKQSLQIISSTFSDYVFNYTSLSSLQPYLIIAAIPQAASVYQTILIRKITITETPPAPTFTLSPASVNKVCGTGLTQTFTVNNVNNSPGVTAYTWNLGSAINGWTYNGSQAPQYISTTSNTLTLSTSDCGLASVLQNINASASIGSTNYNTNASTITTTLPALSITGASSICGSSSSYSIANVPCSAGISWTSSYPGIASVPSSGNPVTVTAVSNGAITLSAAISNACGLPTTNITKDIAIGLPSVGGTYTNTFDGSSNPLGFYPAIMNPACTGYNIQTNMQISGASSVNWTKVSSTGIVNYTQNGNDINFYLFASNQNVVFRLDASNGCGTTSDQFAWLSSNCGGGGGCFTFQVSPNPTTTQDVNVIVPNIPPPCKPTSFTAAPNNNLLITEVQVYDNTGNLKRTVKEAGTKQSKVNLSGMIPGIYYIEITGNNNYKERQKFIKQ